jgi:nucleotide-binding universal stress UspA family protein
VNATRTGHAAGPIEVLVRGGDRRRAVRWAATEARRRGVGLDVIVLDEAVDVERAPGSAFARLLRTVREAVPGLAVAAHRGAAAVQSRSVDASMVVVPADLPELGAVVAGSYCPVAVVPERAANPGGAVVVGVVPWTTEATLELAFAAAHARRTKVVAVRAWDDPAVDLGLLRPDRIARWDRVEQRARTELELALSAERVVHPEVPVDLVVVQDRPAELLLAMTGRAQLLVLGRSERGALLSSLVGSPVDALLRAARCPVVVVPADGPPRTTWLPGRDRGWALTRP